MIRICSGLCGDLKEIVFQKYQFNTVIYGLACAPYLAIFCINWPTTKAVPQRRSYDGTYTYG